MEPAPLIDQLDGFLQRLSGDAYEQLAATSHGDELMGKHEFAADIAASTVAGPWPARSPDGAGL